MRHLLFPVKLPAVGIEPSQGAQLQHWGPWTPHRLQAPLGQSSIDDSGAEERLRLGLHPQGSLNSRWSYFPSYQHTLHTPSAGCLFHMQQLFTCFKLRGLLKARAPASGPSTTCKLHAVCAFCAEKKTTVRTNARVWEECMCEKPQSSTNVFYLLKPSAYLLFRASPFHLSLTLCPTAVMQNPIALWSPKPLSFIFFFQKFSILFHVMTFE